MTSQPDGRPAQRITLVAAPPVRALAIAAAAELLGALLLVGWAALDLPLVAAVLGGLLLALGTVLLAAALVLTGRLRTEVELTADAIAVSRAGQRRTVPWAEVREVTLDYPRLQLLTKDPARGLVITNPRPAPDPRFEALQDAVRRRLDADRGYRELG